MQPKIVLALGALIAGVLFFSRGAFGEGQWSEPAPPIRYLRRETRAANGSPLVVHAAFVDLCDASVVFRVTAPDERALTVSDWGRLVHAVVAVNGDYFDRNT